MADSRLSHGCCLAMAIVAANLPAAYAQGYPAKPIRFVSPYPAAGINDIIARIVALKM